jgi:mono/diheme cytochrome c family protein
MAMMYVESEDEIREWILDGRPWRLALRDSLEARAIADARSAQHRAHLDSLSAAGDSAAAAAERVSAEELLSRRLRRSGPDAPPRPPLHMPAYRGLVTDQQIEDLVAYYKVVADYGEMPEGIRAGYRAARDLGCFGCHGPGGLIGSKNPRSFKGYIPPWRGDDFHELVRNDAELKAWILDGRIPRLERNRAATYFTRRQQIKMPAYRGIAPDSTLAALMGYVKWVSNGAATSD